MSRIKDKIVYWFYVVIRILYVLWCTVVTIPSFCVYMHFLLIPLLRYNAGLYWKIENTLYEWLLYIISSWSWCAEYVVEEVGEDVSRFYDDECLVVVNHQSTADVPILMQSFQEKPKMFSHLMWIMDVMFKWTNFGLVSATHGDFFIASGKNKRKEMLENLQDHIIKIYQPRGYKWIVLFPEGGFLRKQKARSQAYAQRNGYPVMNNVSLPRIGAMQEILTTMTLEKLTDLVNLHKVKSLDGTDCIPRPLKGIIDITVGYPDGKPLDFFVIAGKMKPPCRIMMYYRYFPVNIVPTDSEQLVKWLNERWSEKDLHLEEFYKTGKFPSTMASNCDESTVNVNESKVAEVDDNEAHKIFEEAEVKPKLFTLKTMTTAVQAFTFH